MYLQKCVYMYASMCAFIQTFSHSGYFYSASSNPLLYTQRRSRHSTDPVSEFHAEAPQATASEKQRHA